ncbi:Ktr system potassium uptake protein C K(+)-uptake protein ktrC [Proteiniborus sp. DW1]|uniref:potassium channel family protein n=1 Tax=Proteiniborus sp. DW1 TaxID=1889883 RepID=UPI00092DFE96|nr:TrkA family potassium uptake protein [Proteiniborus sp. DW1]SCG82640.1 Ktr system potassium uptake protein C K(+)-uptake protein ktrC [Proteiniborus sp. DW1]
MKQFVVIGCGRFGTSVAKTLYNQGHDVLAIDKDEEIVQEISDSVTYAAQADVEDEYALKALGIRNFDVAVVSIGSDIQASIMATLIVKELGVKTVVAKAQNDVHAKVLYKIGADKVVFPERDMGVRLAHNLVSSSVIDYIEFDPDYSIVEITATKEWEYKTLNELKLPSKYGINVIAIKKKVGLNISPNADEAIMPGDVLIVIGSNTNLANLEKKSGLRL